MSATKPPRSGRPPSTARRMTWMLILFVVVFGGVFLLWLASQYMLNSFFDNMPQPAVEVSTYEARAERWSSTAEAVGTLVADNVLTLESSRKYGCKHPQTRNAPDRVSHLRACTQSRGLPRLQDLLI